MHHPLRVLAERALCHCSIKRGSAPCTCSAIFEGAHCAARKRYNDRAQYTCPRMYSYAGPLLFLRCVNAQVQLEAGLPVRSLCQHLELSLPVSSMQASWASSAASAVHMIEVIFNYHLMLRRNALHATRSAAVACCRLSTVLMCTNGLELCSRIN